MYDVVMGIVKPTASVFVRNGEPLPADEGEHDVAAFDRPDDRGLTKSVPWVKSIQCR